MPFLTDEDRYTIASAIAEAERSTSGELVAVVAQSAGDYRHLLLWPALVALLLPAIVLTIGRARRPGSPTLPRQSCFSCLRCSPHLPVSVRMALVPDWIKRRRASRRPREQFFGVDCT